MIGEAGWAETEKTALCSTPLLATIPEIVTETPVLFAICVRVCVFEKYKCMYCMPFCANIYFFFESFFFLDFAWVFF